MEEKIKLTLTGIKENNKIIRYLQLPTDDNKIKEKLKAFADIKFTARKLNGYEKSEIPVDILSTVKEIIELNHKLKELNKLADSNEITALVRSFNLENIQDVIDKVKSKDYKYYTSNEITSYGNWEKFLENHSHWDIYGTVLSKIIEDNVFEYIRIPLTIEDFEPDLIIECLEDMELLFNTGYGIVIPNENEKLCLC